MVLIQLEEIVKILNKELQNNKNSKIMIVADNDLDGITSAVLLDNMLYQFEFESKIEFRDPIDWSLPIKNIQKEHPGYLFLLDIASDSVENLRITTKVAKNVFQIDHHITDMESHPKKIVMYNPCYKGEYYLPTVFLVDEISKKIATIDEINVENNILVLLLGLYADAAISYHNLFDKYSWHCEPKIKSHFKEMEKQFPSYFDIEKKGSIEYPIFQKMVKCVDYYVEEQGYEEVLNQLINSYGKKEGVKELLNKITSKFEYIFENLIVTVSQILDKSDKNRNIIEFRNTTDHTNGVLSRFLTEHSGKTSVVYSDANEMKVSSRLPRNISVSLVPIFNKYGGGGHPRACGGKISSNEVEVFVKEIEKLVS
ncbi:MAG: DHHA1 domain-containing protein [Candidatus Ranarchaeia archaeon]